MNAGDVFRFAGIAEAHVWTIISDPSVDPKTVLMVNFTTYDRFCDQACILDAGAHPCIKHRTCVEYGRAKVVENDVLEQLKSTNRLQLQDRLRPDILKSIRLGAMSSDRIKTEQKQILIDQGLADDFGS